MSDFVTRWVMDWFRERLGISFVYLGISGLFARAERVREAKSHAKALLYVRGGETIPGKQ